MPAEKEQACGGWHTEQAGQTRTGARTHVREFLGNDDGEQCGRVACVSRKVDCRVLSALTRMNNPNGEQHSNATQCGQYRRKIGEVNEEGRAERANGRGRRTKARWFNVNVGKRRVVESGIDGQRERAAASGLELHRENRRAQDGMKTRWVWQSL